MLENTPPAAATPAAPANIDLTPVITAINALGDKLPKTAPALGAEPVSASRIEVLGNPTVEKFNSLKHDHVARAKFLNQDHMAIRAELIKAQGGGVNPVFAANTVDSSLANTLLSATFLTTARTKTAMLSAFAHKIEIAPKAPRDTIQVELVSSSGSAQTNPTSFETGDTTSALVSVAVSHLSKSFYVGAQEANVGLALAAKAPTNAKILSEKLVATVTALMTTGNFGSATAIGAASSFDAADLPAILALAKNYDSATLILDKGHLAYLLPTDRTKFAYGESGAYGFDGGIYGNNLWTGAATNAAGFITGPDSIVWGAAPAANMPSGEFLSEGSITLDCGVVVKAYTWFSRSSRSIWGSFDVCFGAAVGDATQAEVLVTS